MEKTTFTAPDIVCSGCANAIKKAVGGVQGVSQVDVDVDAKRVDVTHENAVAREALVDALDRAGFAVAQQ